MDQQTVQIQQDDIEANGHCKGKTSKAETLIGLYIQYYVLIKRNKVKYNWIGCRTARSGRAPPFSSRGSMDSL